MNKQIDWWYEIQAWFLYIILLVLLMLGSGFLMYWWKEHEFLSYAVGTLVGASYILFGGNIKETKYKE